MEIMHGRNYEATCTGSLLKEVVCENCDSLYVYRLERSGIGAGRSHLWLDNRGAQSRSRREAESQRAHLLSFEVNPVACPRCGWLQKSMCRGLRKSLAYCALAFWVIVGIIVWIVILDYYPGSEPFPGLVGLGTAAIGIPVAWTLFLLHQPNRRHPGKGQRDPQKAADSDGLLMDEISDQQWANYHHVLLHSIVMVGSKSGDRVVKRQRIPELYRAATQIEVSLEQY